MAIKGDCGWVTSRRGREKSDGSKYDGGACLKSHDETHQKL
jgi:hypothetical protein